MASQKSHFTVLLVPSDNKRVREFKLTYTTAVLVPLFFVVVILGGFYYFANMNDKLTAIEAEKRISQDEAQEAMDENILLQADIEELNGLLGEAQLALDQKNATEQTITEENTKKSIPDSFPVAGGVGVPTEYTAENPFIQFTVGENTRIVATGAGTVSSITETVDSANEIKIDHGNGYISTYTCKGMIVVNEGDSVIRSNTLIVSMSGQENPEENLVLTYQLEFNGVSIDPMSMIEVNG